MQPEDIRRPREPGESSDLGHTLLRLLVDSTVRLSVDDDGFQAALIGARGKVVTTATGETLTRAVVALER